MYYDLMVKKARGKLLTRLNLIRADNNLHEMVSPNGYCSYLKKEKLDIVIQQDIICFFHCFAKIEFWCMYDKKNLLFRESHYPFDGLVCIY